MENQENKVELDDLRRGLGVIANVMLLGQLISEEHNGVTEEQLVTNYKDLCRMTGTCTRKLIEDNDKVEINWCEDAVTAREFRKIQAMNKVSK
ncbi:hypothetical protein [Lactococcus lactis]|uniref:hypothetical protein n=1 Tax=Lactococcus lactis TaxID=1358 RepID=UPI0024101092|nr:hypothetical protein [Lactococcus lactis]